MKELIEKKLEELIKDRETQNTIYNQAVSTIKQMELNLVSLNGSIQTLQSVLEESIISE
jgi:hypothetical protein